MEKHFCDQCKNEIPQDIVGKFIEVVETFDTQRYEFCSLVCMDRFHTYLRLLDIDRSLAHPAFGNMVTVMVKFVNTYKHENGDGA